MRKFVLLVGAVLTLTLGLLTPASAVTPGALTPATASANCQAFFGVVAGPEPLSACQWDMRAIGVGAASYANATGDGVDVGVIDSGVDFNQPDLVGWHRRRAVVLVHLLDHADGRPAGGRQR